MASYFTLAYTPLWTCRLLNVDMSHLSSRLMTMKLAAGSTQVDVIKIVQDHPSLLLQQSFVLDQQVLLRAMSHTLLIFVIVWLSL